MDHLDNLRFLHEIMIQQNWSLGLAESCTGGLLASEFVQRSGASKYFRGSLVTYQEKVKVDLLSIEPDVLAEKTAVCAEVALSMAYGAQRLLKCDWALSVTGWADVPAGSKGQIFYAVCGKRGIGSKFAEVKEEMLQGSREANRKKAVEGAVSLLAQTLKKT